MTSSFRALVWEQWKQSQTGIIFASIAVTLFAFFPELMKILQLWDSMNHDLFEGGEPFLLYLFTAPLFFVHGHQRDLRVSFPKRLYTMPVSTWKIGLAQAYKVLVPSFFVLIATLISIARYETTVPWWATTGLCLVVGAWVQLIAFSLTALGWRKVCLLFPALLGGMYFLWLRTCLLLTAIMPSLEEKVLLAAVGVFGFLFFPLLLSYPMLRVGRSGFDFPWKITRVFQGKASKVSLAAKPWGAFGSPRLKAQCWFEWRNTLRYMPVILFWVFLCLGLYGYAQDPFDRRYVMVTFPMSCAVPVAALVGFYLLYATPRYRAFVYTKPVTSPQLAKAKLAAGAVALLLSTGLFLLTLLPEPRMWPILKYEWPVFVLGLWGAMMIGRLALGFLVTGWAVVLSIYPLWWLQRKFLDMDETTLVLIAYGLFLAVLFGLALWAKQKKWLCARYLPWLMGVVVAFFGVVSIVVWMVEENPSAHLIPILAPLLLAPLLLVSALFCEAYLRGLIHARHIGWAAAGIPLSALGVFGLFGDPGDAEHTLVLLSGMALVWAPLAWVPLTVHWQRHQ
jgi:hypothetical protein